MWNLSFVLSWPSEIQIYINSNVRKIIFVICTNKVLSSYCKCILFLNFGYPCMTIHSYPSLKTYTNKGKKHHLFIYYKIKIKIICETSISCSLQNQAYLFQCKVSKVVIILNFKNVLLFLFFTEKIYKLLKLLHIVVIFYQTLQGFKIIAIIHIFGGTITVLLDI